MAHMSAPSQMPLNTIGGSGVDGADIWGWTDPQTSREYAIFGLENGTSFIDVTDPTDPVYLFSGEFYNSFADLRIKGRGFDFVQHYGR